MSREKRPVGALWSLLCELAGGAGLILVLSTTALRPAVTADRFRTRPQQPGEGSAVILQPGPARPVVPTLAAIRVSFRLDPWLISGNYGSGFWVSPPVLAATQGGNTFTVEARAAGVGVQGQAVNISPQWIPSDPAMVVVFPNGRHTVRITIRGAGQSVLRVAFPGFSKELSINAVTREQGGAFQVEIAQ